MVGDLKTPAWFENPYEGDRFLIGVWENIISMKDQVGVRKNIYLAPIGRTFELLGETPPPYLNVTMYPEPLLSNVVEAHSDIERLYKVKLKSEKNTATTLRVHIFRLELCQLGKFSPNLVKVLKESFVEDSHSHLGALITVTKGH